MKDYELQIHYILNRDSNSKNGHAGTAQKIVPMQLEKFTGLPLSLKKKNY